MSVYPVLTALLNPQKASESGHSVLSSGALSRESGDGIVAESERLEVTGWIDPIHRQRRAR